MKILLGSDRETMLRQIPDWQINSDQHLERQLAFPDFVSALAAVNKIAAIAETAGHHPDLHLAWGKVRIELWTHSVNNLTEKDFLLAKQIDAALLAFS